jgi:hypothetical protein
MLTHGRAARRGSFGSGRSGSFCTDEGAAALSRRLAGRATRCVGLLGFVWPHRFRGGCSREIHLTPPREALALRSGSFCRIGPTWGVPGFVRPLCPHGLHLTCDCWRSGSFRRVGRCSISYQRPQPLGFARSKAPASVREPARLRGRVRSAPARPRACRRVSGSFRHFARGAWPRAAIPRASTPFFRGARRSAIHSGTSFPTEQAPWDG